MAPLQSQRLRPRIETDFSGLDPLQLEWDRVVTDTGAPIYMTYDWLRTWWQFYGKGKRLRLFLFWNETGLAAIVPLYIETFWKGPLKTAVARLVGANVPPKTFNPPVPENVSMEVFAQVCTRIFLHDKCALLAIGPVSSSWRAMDGCKQACASADARICRPADVVHRGSHTVFHLPSSYDEYLATLSKNERSGRRKRLRKLEQRYRVTTDIIASPIEVEREFEAFLVQHARQWQAVGKGGHFEAWPNAEDFNRTLVKRQARHHRVRFFRLLADEGFVASRYTFLLGHTLFSELPARTVGEPWDALGIGVSSLLKFNEEAILSGIRCIDSGLGDYTHKTQLGGEEIPVVVLRVFARPWFRRIKGWAVVLAGTAVMMLFQKLWYRRIVPRLPSWAGRSQSLAWLRYDV